MRGFVSVQYRIMVSLLITDIIVKDNIAMSFIKLYINGNNLFEIIHAEISDNRNYWR